MKVINSQSKASYRDIVSFVAEKGVKIVQKNESLSEWVKYKATSVIEGLLFEGEWKDGDDIDVELAVLTSLRSAALSTLGTVVPESKSDLNGLISFLRI